VRVWPSARCSKTRHAPSLRPVCRAISSCGRPRTRLSRITSAIVLGQAVEGAFDAIDQLLAAGRGAGRRDLATRVRQRVVDVDRLVACGVAPLCAPIRRAITDLAHGGREQPPAEAFVTAAVEPIELLEDFSTHGLRDVRRGLPGPQCPAELQADECA
jgi:hypothetical protein